MADQTSDEAERSKRSKSGLGRTAKPRDAEAKIGTPQRSAQAGRLTSKSDEASAITIVGIGASAGGIEALSQFFDAMPIDSGCAFVVVLHLDPKRESELARILSAHTTMPVVQVADGMRLVPGHVYVIAPNSDLKVGDGGLHMSKPVAPRGHGHPIDVLFRSLAMDQRERAIAIVLSGTGSNGTEGLKDIRAAGGMSLVQSPETAKFDGMPRSAISANMADYILAPEKMPETLLAYLRHDYVSAPVEIEGASADGQATLEQVLELLRARGGHDFRSYKELDAASARSPPPGPQEHRDPGRIHR